MAEIKQHQVFAKQTLSRCHNAIQDTIDISRPADLVNGDGKQVLADGADGFALLRLPVDVLDKVADGAAHRQRVARGLDDAEVRQRAAGQDRNGNGNVKLRFMPSC